MKLKHIALIGSLFPILFSLVLFFGVLISAVSSCKNQGIDDLNVAIQSYNYGGGYVGYVAGKGKNIPTILQRASPVRNRAEKSNLHQPDSCCEEWGLAVWLWKYVLCGISQSISDRGTL